MLVNHTVMLDLYARRVMGWSMRVTLERELGVAALHDALGRGRPDGEIVQHSDRGSKCASGSYQQILRAHAFTARMSRKGNCWDNAVMESFFATLKAELPAARFASHQAARGAMFDYIERFYNRQRRHSTRGYRSPAEQECFFCDAQKRV